MKTASPGMQTYLAGNPTEAFIADLYTFTLVNGNVLRWSTWDQAITVGGNTYSPFTINRTKIKSSVGLQVASCDVVFEASPANQVGSIPILQAAQLGYFDAAFVSILRLIMPTPGDTSLGTIIWFVGSVGDIKEVGRTRVSLVVNSLVELLNVQMPHNLFQPGCRHTLFDPSCTLNKFSFTFSGTVQAGGNKMKFPTNLTQPGPINPPSTPSLSYTTPSSGVNLPATTYYVQITYVSALGESTASAEASLSVPANSLLVVNSPSSATGATGWNCYVGQGPGTEQRQGSVISLGTNYTEPASGTTQGIPPPSMATGGYFALGVVTFTSGQNSGISRAVEQYFSDGTVQVHPSLPFTPANGDTFSIVAGCDKQMSTCRQKFNNLINFGGEPFIPTPESSI